MEFSFATRKGFIAAACALLLACAAFLFFFRTAAANVLWKVVRLPALSLALDQHDAVLAVKIGNNYFGESEYNIPAADEAYRKAISIDPSLPFAHYQLGRVLFVEGKLREAREAFDTELQINPAHFRSFYMRGLVYAYSNKLSEAEADFKTFVEHAPTEWAGYNDLAWVLAREGKYAEAEELLQQAIVSIPNASLNVWLINNLGVQQLNLRKYTEATITFQRAKELAASLTENDWHRAYPGNDATMSASGIAQFQAAIEQNLKTANRKK